MSIIHFISYNNAVPVAISVLLLGAGGAFAATNPEVLYSESKTVLSIDNTYLVNKDLSAFNPRTEIVGVTEDEEHYYVAYDLYTIDLDNYVWGDVVQRKTMKVSKAMLGPYRDLGVYVTQQLKENIEQEQRRLTETQAIEQRSISQKVVATEYGGLIGKMLDTTTETLPGYTPVVAPQAPERQVAAVSQTGESVVAPAPSVQEQGGPIVQVLGNNPANISVGSTYSDLGAAIVGPTDADRNLGLHIFVNDKEVSQPNIDTSVAGNWFIRYEATNEAGKRGVAERVVIVTDPNAPAVPEELPQEIEETSAEPAADVPAQSDTPSTNVIDAADTSAPTEDAIDPVSQESETASSTSAR